MSIHLMHRASDCSMQEAERRRARIALCNSVVRDMRSAGLSGDLKDAREEFVIGVFAWCGLPLFVAVIWFMGG